MSFSFILPFYHWRPGVHCLPNITLCDIREGIVMLTGQTRLDQNIYLTFNYKTAFITLCEAGCWVLTPTSTFINTRGFWFDSPSVFYNTTENHRLIFYTELITFIWYFSFQWARPVTQRGWSSLSGFPRDSGAEYTPTITTGGRSRTKPWLHWVSLFKTFYLLLLS